MQCTTSPKPTDIPYLLDRFGDLRPDAIAREERGADGLSSLRGERCHGRGEGPAGHPRQDAPLQQPPERHACPHNPATANSTRVNPNCRGTGRAFIQRVKAQPIKETARPHARNSIARNPPDSRENSIAPGDARPRSNGRRSQEGGSGRRWDRLRGMYRRTKIREGSRRRRRRRSTAAARRWMERGENAKREMRRVVVGGDFFWASSDLSGRRYGSDG